MKEQHQNTTTSTAFVEGVANLEDHQSALERRREEQAREIQELLALLPVECSHRALLDEYNALNQRSQRVPLNPPSLRLHSPPKHLALASPAIVSSPPTLISSSFALPISPAATTSTVLAHHSSLAASSEPFIRVDQQSTPSSP